MSRPTRTTPIARLASLVACLACVCLIAPAGAAAAKKGSEAGVRFTIESTQAYEQQLAAGEIRAAKFNTPVRSLHLTLADGRHVLVKYPPHGEPKLAAELRAHGISVPVLKKGHHKLRYIAAVVVIVALLIVAAVLLRTRRRGRDDEY
jgi:hypothetical protein